MFSLWVVSLSVFFGTAVLQTQTSQLHVLTVKLKLWAEFYGEMKKINSGIAVMAIYEPIYTLIFDGKDRPLDGPRDIVG